jgi:hypothetical protein
VGQRVKINEMLSSLHVRIKRNARGGVWIQTDYISQIYHILRLADFTSNALIVNTVHTKLSLYNVTFLQLFT